MIANALSALFPGRNAAAAPGPLDPFWYAPVGSVSSAGISVKPDAAMGVSAVWGCIRVLRESLGSLPFRVYRSTGPKSSETARDHYLWTVLHNRPNRWQTPMEWKEMGVCHLCLRGNYYCQIVGAGDAMQLVPLNPDAMKVSQNADGSLKYTYRRKVGDLVEFSQENIFHVRGMSMNGITGVSVLEYARNTVGLAIAQETHGASLFRNGGLPAFWISRPKPWPRDGQARTNFRAGWRAIHGGPENAGNPPILEDDMQLHELGLTNRDSQWLESRGMQAEEVCRFFGVPPHMIGLSSKEALGSTEQKSIEFVTYTLSPLAIRFEQSANRDLLDDPEEYYTKIVLDGLLRGDMLSRYQAHNIAIQGGWELVNEARELEDRNPIEGGDTPRYPLNMQPAGSGPDQNEQGGQPGKGTPKPAQQKQQEAAPVDEPTPREKQRQKKKAAQAAFAVLLDEAAARIAAAEIHGLSARADKAAEDRAKWNEWAVEFYHRHQAYAAKVLDPICAAWLAQTDLQCDPEELAASLCAAVGPIFDVMSDVVACVEGWKETRADDLATKLKERFFDETL
jgi:HK97 family phage portal protein